MNYLRQFISFDPFGNHWFGKISKAMLLFGVFVGVVNLIMNAKEKLELSW